MKATLTFANSDSTNSFPLTREGFLSMEHAQSYGHGLASKISATMGEPHFLIRVEMGADFSYIPHASYWAEGVTEA